MKPGMQKAQADLERLLEANDLTQGMRVRVHGESLIVGRLDDVGPKGAVDNVDRVRLTRLSKTTWGLGVKRHTGRWERTPFSGPMSDVVDAMCAFMQHLIAPR